ncbi:MAG: hypothetical protein ACD_7C00001G0002 [uncultured bacterium]|nr:MAG: hypothetical protein ACD_7C00001G0002 [uncultured bacterium]
MGVNAIKKVYLLFHVKGFKKDIEDVKLLGVFSSIKKAREIMNTHKTLPGFKDYIDDFLIEWYMMDKSEWKEGYEPYNYEVKKKNTEKLTDKIDNECYKSNYPTGPYTEFDKIKKWGDSAWE